MHVIGKQAVGHASKLIGKTASPQSLHFLHGVGFSFNCTGIFMLTIVHVKSLWFPIFAPVFNTLKAPLFFLNTQKNMSVYIRSDNRTAYDSSGVMKYVVIWGFVYIYIFL